MNPNLTKRGFIRILSYFTALCVFLGVGALINYQAAQRYRQNSEYGYQRALSDLSDSVSNLEVALEKGVYANTAPQQQGIAAKLLKKAATRKFTWRSCLCLMRSCPTSTSSFPRWEIFPYTFPERSAKGRRLPTRRWTALLPWENMPRS